MKQILLSLITITILTSCNGGTDNGQKQPTSKYVLTGINGNSPVTQVNKLSNNCTLINSDLNCIFNKSDNMFPYSTLQIAAQSNPASYWDC